MARHPKWAFMECSARLDYNVKRIFEKVASMIQLN